MVPRWMHDAKTITSVSSILEGHRRTRLHIDDLQERQKNGQFSIKQTGKLLFDSGRSTTRVRNPTSCISSRSARGFTRNTIWASQRSGA